MANVHGYDKLGGSLKSSDLLGMTVRNNQNDKLGKVEDLGVDVESGRILEVVLSTGGFLGIGDTLTAVPPGAFHYDGANKVLHLDADKEKLQSAPKFEMSKWNDAYDSNHLAEAYSHYGQSSALNFIGSGENRPELWSSNSLNTASSRQTEGTWEKSRGLGNHWNIPTARLGQVQRASKLVGTPVNNLQDEKLGKVENLVVDLSSGRILAIVVSSGGFLGIGDELSAVPPTALKFSSDREALQLDATKESLTSAPHFKANQWPDFSQPGYASGLYRSYKVDPYFTSDQPDNTARNVRDSQGNTLTPLDQGHSQADRDMTAAIRKEIMASKDMSVNARNVKIITVDGRVTLRGPVKTSEEKRAIGDIADRIATSGNVDNQLEVKTTTE